MQQRGAMIAPCCTSTFLCAFLSAFENFARKPLSLQVRNSGLRHPISLCCALTPMSAGAGSWACCTWTWCRPGWSESTTSTSSPPPPPSFIRSPRRPPCPHVPLLARYTGLEVAWDYVAGAGGGIGFRRKVGGFKPDRQSTDSEIYSKCNYHKHGNG